MPTASPALPVPPLTEEQPFDAEAFTVRLNEKVAARRAVMLRQPDSVLAVANARFIVGTNNPKHEPWLSNMELLVNEIDKERAETTRLSHLLEEERRTGAELKGKMEKGWNLLHYGVSAIMSDDAEGAVKCWNEGATLLYLPGHRDIRPDFAPPLDNGPAPDYFVQPQQHADGSQSYGPYGAAPTCQRDCQKCDSRSMVDQSPEIIGFYETSGLPVREGDDYVTDVEGCYLTRAEADELAQEAAGGAGVGLQGEEGGGRG